jgi:hypothetical protein
MSDYIFPTKWEMLKLRVLSHFSKKAREQLYYIKLDIYYWYLWQSKQRKILEDLYSSTLSVYSKRLVNWIGGS